ncbi:MAG: hypothetical protein O2973_03630 [Gemmatimonadetes bacterium]|nr:hypothetical protein [Gemmatimonadota bacterium]
MLRATVTRASMLALASIVALAPAGTAWAHAEAHHVASERTHDSGAHESHGRRSHAHAPLDHADGASDVGQAPDVTSVSAPGDRDHHHSTLSEAALPRPDRDAPRDGPAEPDRLTASEIPMAGAVVVEARTTYAATHGKSPPDRPRGPPAN